MPLLKVGSVNIDKDMRLNLSSQIVLNKVPVEFYKPKTTVEYSEISRMEKILEYLCLYGRRCQSCS